MRLFYLEAHRRTMVRQLKIFRLIICYYFSRPDNYPWMVGRFKLSDIRTAKYRYVFVVFALQATVYTTIFLSLFDLSHPMSIPTAIGAGVSFAMFQNVERFARP
jgi:hypothetical protein